MMDSTMIRRACVWMVAIVCCVNMRAQPTRFYDAEQLTSNQITSLCQDRQGYIWIGTEYGLNKFDGTFVKQYYTDDDNHHSLISNIVRCLMLDRDGTLWVVTNRGVQRYNRATDDFDAVMFGGRFNANINDIEQTADGRIWLLSAQNGIYEVDCETLKARGVVAANKHIDHSSETNNMYVDHKGRLWVSYRSNGLQHINLKTDKSHYYADQLQPDNRAIDLTEDRQGRLLVLTYNALLRLDEGTMNLEPVVSYARNDMTHLFHDRQGRLLAGTYGSGLWLLDTDSRMVKPVSVQTQAVNMNIAKVQAYLEDSGGNQWIGCFERGVLFCSSRPTPFHFMPFSKLPTNNGNMLRTLYADDSKNVYVCQEKGGIAVNSPDGQVVNHWMKGYTVTSVCHDRQGRVLAGTYRDGLFRIDPLTGRQEHLVDAEQRIPSIAFDREGNIYTAVFGDGLRSYTPDGKTARVLGQGGLKLHNRYLNKLFTAKDGKIWIGHYYGIDIYDPQTNRLVDISVPDVLRSAIVYAISQSPKENSIWIGSNKGLFQYYTEGAKKGQWKRFTTKQGLPNNIISSMVVTPDGTIWAGTYRGLAQIETDGTFTRYYRGNGLEQWVYLRGVYAWTGIGEVVLGNQDGITYFDPSHIVKNDFKQGITLTGMRLGQTDVNVGTLSNGKRIITQSIDSTDVITVSYYDNTFSLRFSPMDFRDAQNIHYEFRFVGEGGDQWYQTESGRSEIYFSHLSVGSHRLQVRAYDNGVYSPVKTLTLRISPPWYRTWAAYVFYLLVLLAIGLLSWRSYRNRQQAEANEERIKFFVDISHELRSPLTLIKSPLDQLLKDSRDANQQRALRNIERNTNRLLTLTNQILSIRKIEKGQMQLHFAETKMGDFVNDICHTYDYQAGKRHITLTFDNQAGDMMVWIDRDHFDKVITNLLGNAMKYVEDGGKVQVTLRKTVDDHAELTVRDNGPGIDESQLRKVFERFYQASARPAAGQMSYGIGLNLTQKLIELHKGTIAARNRIDGHGAEFVVRLQLGNRHLPKDSLVTLAEDIAPVGEGSAILQENEESPRRIHRKKTNYRIVVVDDDEEMRNFLQTELGESYRVTTYPDGKQALEGIVDTVPDLVISDVVMPVMDGFELLKRIKGSTTTSHIPVILLTTQTEHLSRVAGLEQGADAYIDKPFNFEELEANIAGLIANRMRMKGKFSGMQEQENTVRKIELKGNDAALMEKIMNVVNRRIDDSDFNVEALASEVGLSRVQLHRRMKELTGLPVGDFIRNLRLQQAAKLLAAGDTTVSQVTYAVGFSNPTHFSTAFKKHFGVTPSEYIIKAANRREQDESGYDETKSNVDETIAET